MDIWIFFTEMNKQLNFKRIYKDNQDVTEEYN